MESTNFEQQLQEQSLQEHYVGCPPSVADHRRLYNHQFGGGVASSGLHDQWSTTSILSTTSSNSNSYIKYENNEIPEDHKITIPTFSLIASQPFDHPSLFSHHDHQSTHVASSDWFNTFISGVSHNRESLHHISTYDSLLSQLGLASCSSTSSGLGPNLLGLELLGGSGFEAQVQTQARDTSWSHGDASDQSSNSTSANSPNQKTTSSLTGTKRPATRDHSGPPSKPSALVASKKAQLKSCPPFKVRKEKLGDRIAALHQLVSPFGKTDTASVLTEAIGYIQFLQDQIHNLCMPNAKPPRHKPCRTFRMGPSEEEEKQKPKQDLRSRGLCLMPTSWTSYITPIHMDASHHHYPYF